MIIDGHAHLTATESGSADTLLRQLDFAGIDRCLCVPGGMVDVSKFTWYLTGRLRPDPVIPNYLVYDALRTHPDRFYGLVCINPHEGSKAIDMLNEGLDRGCRGVKLAPNVHGLTFDQPAVNQAAEVCGQHGFPVYSHVLYNPAQPGNSTSDFVDLARRHPRTSFIIGHMGFGPCDCDAIEAARDLPNFYLESSLGNYLAMCQTLADAGPEKLIFGSEFPLSHPKAELEKIRLLDEEHWPLILSDNLLRLLALPTPAGA
jgi:predicted TIM-barrel fold metal-dependent hydrolase